MTRILSRIEQGDGQAAEQLLPLLYEELRKLAAAKMSQENPAQTLRATALVQEAYLRLIEVERVRKWDSRGPFFAAAAEAMRRILIENARRKQSPKRGGNRQRVSLESVDCFATVPAEDLLALDEALEQLAVDAPLQARLVKLRCFAGLSHQEAAETLGISRPTAHRYWAYAKVRLYCAIHEPDDG